MGRPNPRPGFRKELPRIERVRDDIRRRDEGAAKLKSRNTGFTSDEGEGGRFALA